MGHFRVVNVRIFVQVRQVAMWPHCKNIDPHWSMRQILQIKFGGVIMGSIALGNMELTAHAMSSCMLAVLNSVTSRICLRCKHSGDHAAWCIQGSWWICQPAEFHPQWKQVKHSGVSRINRPHIAKVSFCIGYGLYLSNVWYRRCASLNSGNRGVALEYLRIRWGWNCNGSPDSRFGYMGTINSSFFSWSICLSDICICLISDRAKKYSCLSAVRHNLE